LNFPGALLFSASAIFSDMCVIHFCLRAIFFYLNMIFLPLRAINRTPTKSIFQFLRTSG